MLALVFGAAVTLDAVAVFLGAALAAVALVAAAGFFRNVSSALTVSPQLTHLSRCLGSLLLWLLDLGWLGI